MELIDYLRIIARRKWTILATIVGVLLVVFIGTRLQTPYYESSVTLRVSASLSGQLNYSSTSYVTQLLNTVARIATSNQVLSDLSENLELSNTPEVTSEVIPNTELIKITVADPSPQMAVRAAEAMGEILTARGSQLYIGGGTDAEEVLKTQVAEAESDILKTRQEYSAILLLTPAAPAQADILYQELLLKQRNYDSLLSELQSSEYQNAMRANMITVVEQPIAAATPSRPKMLLNLLIGLAAGLLFGIVIAFIVDNLDSRLYNTDEIERYTGMPIFSRIPKVSKKAISLNPCEKSLFADNFRLLGMKIMQHKKNPPIKTIIVLSAEANQGKSMIVAHLALSLSEFGKKVIAVDFDVHKPKLHQWFDLPNTKGLQDVIQENLDLDSAIQETKFENLHLLASGSKFEKTSLLLATHEVKKLVAALTKQYDFVLLDSPPLIGVGDGEMLSNLADGLILVARREETSREAMQMAGAFINTFSDKFSALIVNHDIRSNGYY